MATDECILLLVATQTGNAERVAETVESVLESAGIRVEYTDMWDAYPEMLNDRIWTIICTSTWGEGELPDNAIDFVTDLDAIEPSLNHLSYGIIGLGDHHYDPNFCAAAGIFEALFERLGAERIVEKLELDEGPSDLDLDACKDWTLAFGRQVIQREND